MGVKRLVSEAQRELILPRFVVRLQASWAESLCVASAVEQSCWILQPPVPGRAEPDPGRAETQHLPLLLQVSHCTLSASQACVVHEGEGKQHCFPSLSQYVGHFLTISDWFNSLYSLTSHRCIVCAPVCYNYTPSVKSVKRQRSEMYHYYSRMWKGLYHHMEKSGSSPQSPADFLTAVREKSQQLEEELTNHREVPAGGTTKHHQPPGPKQGIHDTNIHDSRQNHTPASSCLLYNWK